MSKPLYFSQILLASQNLCFSICRHPPFCAVCKKRNYEVFSYTFFSYYIPNLRLSSLRVKKLCRFLFLISGKTSSIFGATIFNSGQFINIVSFSINKTAFFDIHVYHFLFSLAVFSSPNITMTVYTMLFLKRDFR